MEGRLVIFSAPSGAGKTTIVRHLLNQEMGLVLSVSACTRKPREGEVDGKDYHFISPEAFRQQIRAGAFVEWEEVYKDHFYGTLKSELERIWNDGQHALFDVDVVGGLNLKDKFGDRALAVFVSPPSLDELRQRLTGRSTESRDRMEDRLKKAVREMQYAPRFDRVLVNDRLEDALESAVALVREFLPVKNPEA